MRSAEDAACVTHVSSVLRTNVTAAFIWCDVTTACLNTFTIPDYYDTHMTHIR